MQLDLGSAPGRKTFVRAYSFVRLNNPAILRMNRRGMNRTRKMRTWYCQPGMASSLPLRKARWPWRATAAAGILGVLSRRIFWPCETLPKLVVVGPGQSAVTVNPAPASSYASASVNEST